MADFLHRRRNAVLLTALILLVLGYPIANMADQAHFVLVAATVAFLLACLQEMHSRSHLRLPSRLLVLVWLGLSLVPAWPDLLPPGAVWPGVSATAVLAVLTLGVLALLAQRLAQAEQVDGELLCGAIGGYLLLGVFWSETYEVIGTFAPAAFAGPGGVVPDHSALLYFSFTTLTTTGYGDITAINPLVRMWAVFEAITGTVYNATVIARLVSLYGNRLGTDRR